MARYIVTRLNAQQSPAGVVLDRIAGPGWADTPANLLAHLRAGRHEFQLADTAPQLRLSARPAQGDAWMLTVVDPDGNEVPADRLPHWRIESPRPPPRRAPTWWQRILDPDAA